MRSDAAALSQPQRSVTVTARMQEAAGTSFFSESFRPANQHKKSGHQRLELEREGSSGVVPVSVGTLDMPTDDLAWVTLTTPPHMLASMEQAHLVPEDENEAGGDAGAHQGEGPRHQGRAAGGPGAPRPQRIAHPRGRGAWGTGRTAVRGLSADHRECWIPMWFEVRAALGRRSP